MPKVSAGSLSVRGRAVAIFVDTSDGMFSGATFRGDEYHAATRAELHEKLTAATRQSIAVPIVGFIDGEVLRGTVTGKHAANDNYMIKWEGKKGAEQTYSLREFLQLNDAALERYRELVAAEVAATAAVEKFEADHKCDLKKIVEDALNFTAPALGGAA